MWSPFMARRKTTGQDVNMDNMTTRVCFVPGIERQLNSILDALITMQPLLNSDEGWS